MMQAAATMTMTASDTDVHTGKGRKRNKWRKRKNSASGSLDERSNKHAKNDGSNKKNKTGCNFLKCALTIQHTNSVFVQPVNKNGDDYNLDKKDSTVSLKSPCGDAVGIADIVVTSMQSDITDNDKRCKGKKRKKHSRSIIITTCLLPPFPGSSLTNLNDEEQRTYPQCKIHILPLLILDLNGILCHRIRKNTGPAYNTSPDSVYRASCANIANTQVIPRPNLDDFLCFLNQYFTLAVWTSAQKRTANRLVGALFPKSVKDKLLFIWGQNKCDVLSSLNSSFSSDSVQSKKVEKNNGSKGKNGGEINDDDHENGDNTDTDDNNSIGKNEKNQQLQHQFKTPKPIFTKSLSKVWQSYPLWNETNTILLDDSAEKIPKPFVQNALHPPPISGLKATNNCTSSMERCMREKEEKTKKERKKLSQLDDDEINEEKQRNFFELLVKCWNDDNEDQEIAKNYVEKKLSEEDCVKSSRYAQHSFVDGSNNAVGCMSATNERADREEVLGRGKDVRIFLSKFGKGHMGWRGGGGDGKDDDA